jgi:hypothetical protein
VVNFYEKFNEEETSLYQAMDHGVIQTFHSPTHVIVEGGEMLENLNRINSFLVSPILEGN